MRPHEYQKLSLRTAPPFQERILTASKDALVHCILGITGEVSEIQIDPENQANVNQEIGDTMWYIALGAFGIGVDLDDIDVNFEIEDPELDLSIQAGIASDLVKRHIYYEVDLNKTKFLKALGSMMACLYVLSGSRDDRFAACLEMNVEKLKLRYPEKYSHENAVNRNVKKENKVFES